MTEASVRAALVKKLRTYKDWTVLRHEDHYTSGIPDISVTGNKITSWWECKLQRGEQLSIKGIQQYTVEQLSRHGFAYYIVFHAEPPRIFIFEPRSFPSHLARWVSPPGLDHDWAVQQVRKVHGL